MGGGLESHGTFAGRCWLDVVRRLNCNTLVAAKGHKHDFTFFRVASLLLMLHIYLSWKLLWLVDGRYFSATKRGSLLPRENV